MKLANIAKYVTDKISSNDVSLETYVTTDSLLQNKRGRKCAINLPPKPCTLTHFQKGDVLVANIRPYLKKIWLSDFEGGCSLDVLVFRTKEKHLPHFLYAILLQDAFYDYVMQSVKGSRMPRGDKDQIMCFEIPSFSYEEEKNIGKLIVDLEKKIQINIQINHNLEAMAKQLYDYWFVQFDFPDENGKPYKSSGGKMTWNEKLKRKIPFDWKVETLGEIFEIVSKKVKKDEIQKLPYTPIEVLPKNEMSFYQTAPIEKALSGLCLFKKGDILLSNRRVYFHKVCIAPFDGVTRDTIIILRSLLNKHIAYNYQVVNSNHFINYATKYSYGSEQPVLSWQNAKKYLYVKPNLSLIELYSNKMNPIINKILKTQIELRTLINQRDNLLHLLMNGQVSVNYDL